MILKILWQVCIEVDRQIEHQKPDNVVTQKNTKKWLGIDVACSVDNDLIMKINKEMDIYSELRLEQTRIWDKKT